MYQKRSSAFTIVELLIVIVVIAILAAITIMAYNGIQSRARDSQRAQDIQTIAKALELYYIDKGEYPNGTNYTPGSTAINGSWSTTADGSWSNLATVLKPYISSLPTSPGANSATPAINGGNHYDYVGVSNTNYCNSSKGQTYLLAYKLESGVTNQTVGTCGGTQLGYYGNGASNYRVVK